MGQDPYGFHRYEDRLILGTMLPVSHLRIHKVCQNWILRMLEHQMLGEGIL